jgi:hypothetical protein
MSVKEERRCSADATSSARNKDGLFLHRAYFSLL